MTNALAKLLFRGKLDSVGIVVAWLDPQQVVVA